MFIKFEAELWIAANSVAVAAHDLSYWMCTIYLCLINYVDFLAQAMFNSTGPS
jgi:hypothetical protein